MEGLFLTSRSHGRHTDKYLRKQGVLRSVSTPTKVFTVGVLLASALAVPAASADGALTSSPVTTLGSSSHSVQAVSMTSTGNTVSRSSARAERTKGEWGGIEELSVGYSQSESQKKAADNLSDTVKSARETYDASANKASDSVRSTLKSECDAADTMIADVRTSEADLTAQNEKVVVAQDAADNAISAWNLSNQRAASKAAAQRSAADMAKAKATYETWLKNHPDSGKGEQVVAFAKQYLGARYVWGGTTPSFDPSNGKQNGGGWDCSGYTMFIFSHFGVSLPHYSGDQAGYGVSVPSLAEAQVGDLIANGTHAAVYAGNGNVINALNPRMGTVITPIKWAFSSSYSIRRLV